MKALIQDSRDSNANTARYSYANPFCRTAVNKCARLEHTVNSVDGIRSQQKKIT
jgi:hypothetical protein